MAMLDIVAGCTALAAGGNPLGQGSTFEPEEDRSLKAEAEFGNS
ncbi:MAG TPA: hypothetical protein VF241_04530 [Propionibacteriaceae bacterium]